MITVIGAGLAGCEAAWQIAERGVPVALCEQKPHKKIPAHHTNHYAELCCSNSLRGDRLENGPGLLKAELRQMNSLILQCADATAVPAGGALAVDRDGFAALVTEKVRNHPQILIRESEITQIPADRPVVVATGPLTEGDLAADITRFFGGAEPLRFYDAAAPLVAAESVDMHHAFWGARYGRGGDDYLNCPLERAEFEAFRDALATAEEVPCHDFEDKKVFEGCMPVEVMARRGADTLRFGCLRPVGLKDPRTGRGAYAILQLRKDNRAGDTLNLVGCQTHLTFPEQRRVFGLIPALANAEFLRYGVMHRNSFINSPDLLTDCFEVRTHPGVFFAGQITGVEGYIESAASGLVAAVGAVRRLRGETPCPFPVETAHGALGQYVQHGNGGRFEPSNIHFGLLPPLENPPRNKQERHRLISERALRVLRQWTI